MVVQVDFIYYLMGLLIQIQLVALPLQIITLVILRQVILFSLVDHPKHLKLELSFILVILLRFVVQVH